MAARRLTRTITPVKPPTPLSDGTPEKQRQAKLGPRGELCSSEKVSLLTSIPVAEKQDKTSIVVLQDANSELDSNSQEKLPSESEVLLTLFSSLELVVQILTLRGHMPLLPQIREDVEAQCSKSLGDIRLKRILALADGMYFTRWNALSGAIEIRQLASDGDKRAPTTDELPVRRAAFEAALMKVKKLDELSVQELPKAPKREVEPLRVTRALPASEHAVASAKPTLVDKSLSASDRLERLRMRVLAKANAGETPIAKATAIVRKKVVVCENAIALHSVVSMLFVKNEKPLNGEAILVQQTSSANRDLPSGTSEAEVVRVAGAQTFAAQAVQRVAPAEARVALVHLAAQSRGWFDMEDGVYNVGAKYLRRRAGASAAPALAALRAECSELQHVLGVLLRGGPSAEAAAEAVVAESKSVEASSAPSVAKVPSAPSARNAPSTPSALQMPSAPSAAGVAEGDPKRAKRALPPTAEVESKAVASSAASHDVATRERTGAAPAKKRAKSVMAASADSKVAAAAPVPDAAGKKTQGQEEAPEVQPKKRRRVVAKAKRPEF